MVNVKFFGLLRSNHGIKSFTINAATMTIVIEFIMTHYPTITHHELNEAVLFINQQKIMHMKRFSAPLTDGDEIVFTTYVGGG